MLEAKRPGVSARRLAREYGLEELRAYKDRSRAGIDALRGFSFSQRYGAYPGQAARPDRLARGAWRAMKRAAGVSRRRACRCCACVGGLLTPGRAGDAVRSACPRPDAH